MILTIRKHFWECFDYYLGVFGSILGHFWVKNRIIPFPAKHFSGRFRAFFGITGPEIRLKTYPKMSCNHHKHFRGYFVHLQGVFRSILSHFWIKTPNFSNLSSTSFGWIQVIFGHYGAQNLSKNVSKNIFEPAETFQGMFRSLLECFFVISGSQSIKKFLI